jgi:hypothetical protein
MEVANGSLGVAPLFLRAEVTISGAMVTLRGRRVLSRGDSRSSKNALGALRSCGGEAL